MNMRGKHTLLVRTCGWVLAALLMPSMGLTCLLLTPIDTSSPSGTTDNSNNSAAVPTTQGTVSFANEIQPIFDANCIRCHVTGGFANQSGIPLKLISGYSYNLMVNKKSAQDPSWIIVVPGAPEKSLLYLKISSPTPPIGRRMPWDAGTVVSDDDILKVATWIKEGAQNN